MNSLIFGYARACGPPAKHFRNRGPAHTLACDIAAGRSLVARLVLPDALERLALADSSLRRTIRIASIDARSPHPGTFGHCTAELPCRDGAAIRIVWVDALSEFPLTSRHLFAHWAFSDRVAGR